MNAASRTCEIRNNLMRPRWPRERAERALLEGALAVHISFDSESHLVRSLNAGARVIVAPTGSLIPKERWEGPTGDYITWFGRTESGWSVCLIAENKRKAT